MPAYVIAHIRVHDPVHYEDYKLKAQASIIAHGGRYIARGGKVEALEGEWRPERLVLLEFPSLEVAKRWWASESYQQAATIRRAYSTGEIVLLEGLDVPIA
jgi:uncharacterized protein (DUF1330 family)